MITTNYTIYLKKQIILLIMLISGFVFSQTNPDLEMTAGASNPTGNGPVLTTSINFQKNTNNPSGNTFVAYTPALSTTYTISNSRYTTTVNNSTTNIGYGLGAGTLIFPTMNNIGVPADANFTSSTSTAGTGMSVTSNNSVRFNIMTYPLRVNALATNGIHAMSDLTITFNRPVNNPVIHIGGLGGTSSAGLGFAARLDLVSSNVPTAGLSLTRLSGNNATGFQVTGLSIFNGATPITADGTNSGSGSVRINGNGITSLTFTLSIRGDGAVTSTTAWASTNTDTGSGDSFTIGISNLESDLQVTKTVNNSTPNEGSNVVFTVTASNLGASNNTNVTVNDLLPTGYTYVSHTASTGTYVPGTGVWTIGNLNDQANATLTITAIVNATGNFTNTATISTTSGIADPNTTNNTASVSTTPVITDSDGDGVPDSLDLDDDNDGILDTTEGQCINTSNPSTDGFDSPLVATVNGNNIQSVNPYNGWGTETGGADAFNVIRVNGAGYSSGPDVAQSGTQYIDINSSSTYVYKDIILTTPTVFSASAWFANRETSIGGYAPWSSNIQIRNQTTNVVVAQGNTVNLTAALGDEYWYKSAITSVSLPAGTYRIRMFVDNFGHLDSISYCFSTDTDGDGTPNYLDLDSDGDGCFDAIEGGDNVTAGMLDGIGRINVAANGTTTPVVVDANGVPVVTNTSSTYNVDGQAQGQTIGQSQINNPAAVAGTVGSNQTIVSGSAPSALSLTGSTGTIQWQSSTDNITFANVSGATSASYSPGTMTSTTYYRAVVSSLGGCSVNTNSVVITVVPNTDSDGDGIVDYYDLDDDNDGITDCDENLLGANTSVSNVFSFVTAGTAVATSNNEVRLTQNTGNQAGQIWSVGKVDFTKSFVLRFDAYFGTNDNGADGIAAVFHNSPQGVNATGAAGLGIGARGIANGIVLELDTYDNGTSLGDIPSDHGQIWDSDNQTPTGFLTTAVALPNLENSIWHPVVINWNASTKTISYTVDGTNAGTYTGDLVTNYFAGASKVYFGYTASTGAFTNEQRIRINSFCSDLPLELDTDGDGIPNSLDLDSDGDGCADAIEGSENVKYNQIHALDLPASDTNYAYRGQIKVTYDGTTTGTPAQIISTSTGANGVPQLVNVAVSNLNASTNPSNLAGAVDNTDGTADIGQGIGDSQNNAVNSCKCYKLPSTDTNTYPTNHGITAFNRAGANNGNWPMVRQSGWTALEASTKGFVINRLTDAQITAMPTASLVAGMMVYNISQDCLQINVDGTSSGWKCFNKQTCPDIN